MEFGLNVCAVKRGRFSLFANCPFFAKYVLNGKNSTFFSKNSGKICVYQKMFVPLHRQTTKTITTMKKIYISLPITGHEDTYEERLQELVKVADRFARYQNLNCDDFEEYEIITPKDVAYGVEDRMEAPKYTDYILACLEVIVDCDIVILGDGWRESRGCRIELNFASNFDIQIMEETFIKRIDLQA